jgi:hypothetical protein
MNTPQLLPEDWRNVFDLAVYVHQHQVLMSGQHVRLHLAACGFSAEASSRLGAIFELFGQLLKRYDQDGKPDREKQPHTPVVRFR